MNQKKPGKISSEFFYFLRRHKRAWIAPILAILLLLALLILFAEGEVMSPILYRFF